MAGIGVCAGGGEVEGESSAEPISDFRPVRFEEVAGEESGNGAGDQQRAGLFDEASALAVGEAGDEGIGREVVDRLGLQARHTADTRALRCHHFIWGKKSSESLKESHLWMRSLCEDRSRVNDCFEKFCCIEQS